MRTCTKCQRELPEESFSWHSGKRRSRCRECESADSAAYRALNIEKARAQGRARYAANREKYREKTRAWRDALSPEDLERIRIYGRNYRRALRIADPELARRKQREFSLRKNYGLSIEEFDSLLESQNGKCAICKTVQPNGRGWHVDHCHKSSTVRGILCSGCNVGLGMFNDDPERLCAAINYLEKATSECHALEAS